jgi:hypothetical protein
VKDCNIAEIQVWPAGDPVLLSATPQVEEWLRQQDDAAEEEEEADEEPE